MSMVMTKSGALLGRGGVEPSDDTQSGIQAAISANTWTSFASMPTQYEVGGKRNSESQELQCLVLELDSLTIAIQTFGEYIACVGGASGVDSVFLREKLGALATDACFVCGLYMVVACWHL